MSEPSKEWKEVIAPDESDRFEGYAKILESMQKALAAKRGVKRALHAKSLGGARATLTINSDLPAHARVGLFAQATTFDALVRFSNGSGASQSDRKTDIRGLAIKVMGVPGKKIIPGLESATTQDLLLIHGAVTPFRTSSEFIFFVNAARRPLTLLPRVIGHFGFFRTLRILKTFNQRFGGKVGSLAEQRFWSAVPIRMGDYAVKVSAKPLAPATTAMKPGSDYLAEDLADRLARGPIEYDLMLQFFCDEQKTPIEDASVEWLESDSPFVTVARLTLPQQDLRSEEGKALAKRIEGMSFDPWHALEEHRPLGDVMRARNPAYRISTQLRQASVET